MATFYMRVQFNSDISKIRKFFTDAKLLNLIFSKDGITMMTLTGGEICYCVATIHACDVYQLRVDTSKWPQGGVIRSIQPNILLTFMKIKGSTDDIVFEVDEAGLTLTVSIIGSTGNILRTVNINLMIPEQVLEPAYMTYANATLKVSDFKKLCLAMSKEQNDIVLDAQSNAIRFIVSTGPIVYGIWNNNESFYSCKIKNNIFKEVIKINIGNAKNSTTGIYIVPEYPLMIKAKLGIVDFLIYSKKWL